MNKFFALGFILEFSLSIVFVAPSNIVSAEMEPSSEINNIHRIQMSGVSLGGGAFAYKMQSHIIEKKDGTILDVTDRYDTTKGVIPGPTIIISEGDDVYLTIKNEIGSGCLGVHVHGVHYGAESDGTRKEINGISDQCSTRPDEEYLYHWRANKGSAGTWPYHDHSLNDKHGAEDRGLFGSLIVNGDNVEMYSDGSITELPSNEIDKEIVVYLADTPFNPVNPDLRGIYFWVSQINNENGLQTELGVNPEIHALTDEKIRFHLIVVGNVLYDVELSGQNWIKPGTNQIIDSMTMGPMEKYVFAIKANPGEYSMDAFSSISRNYLPDPIMSSPFIVD